MPKLQGLTTSRFRLPNVDRRQGVLVVVAVVAVMSAVVGWVAGQQIKSPAEIAAEQRAPEASLISVPVELRELSQKVVVRGTVRASDATEVPALTTAETAVVTRLPKAAGDLVEEGDVMIEISGRPMIALQGQLPVFRNLIPGLEGPDVTQLEESLLRLGHDPGPVDGKYDASTAKAVEGLYTDLGHPAPKPAEADESAVTSASETVTAQAQAVTDAKTALAEAGGTVSGSERLQLDQAVTDAENQLVVTRTSAEQANTAAATRVTNAQSGYDSAVAAAATAADRLAEAEAGTHPDTGKPPTAEELVDLRDENSKAKVAVTDTSNELAEAKAAKELTSKQQDAELSTATGAVEIAKAARKEALEPASTAALRATLTSAEEALAKAKDDLAEGQAKLGAWIPVEELLFLSTTPREVQALAVDIGDKPDGTVMTVTGADTLVESGLPAADRKLVEVGAEALLEEDSLGLSVPAVVTLVADKPGGPNISADRYAMQLKPLEKLPDEALNVNLRISLPISSSGGEVLAVPFAALSAGPDGTARVEVERADGQTEVVEVSTGLRAEGFVQVEPLKGQSLEAGDRVVVGEDVAQETTPAGPVAEDKPDPDSGSDEGSEGSDSGSDSGSDEGSDSASDEGSDQDDGTT